MNHHAEEIKSSLPTKIFGQHVTYFKSTHSTNEILKTLAAENAPEGALAVTEEQTAGRGRFSRTWIAPAHSSLLMSLLFRPAFLPPNRTQWLTMLCTLAATDAIHTVTGITAGIKWPNDLVFGERKLAGFLTELSVTGDALDWVIVGMGLNVNLDFSAIAEPVDGQLLAETATSLQMLTGKPVSRAALMKAYLQQVEARYLALKEGASPLDEWRERLETLGKTISVQTPDRRLIGRAEGVSATGALLVRLDDSRVEEVLAGDVSLRGE